MGAAAALAILFFVIPEPAGAIFGIDLSPAGLITFAFRAVAAILSFLIGIAYMIASYFVNFMLQMNYDVLSTNNGVVDVGWRIVRDVANLGFVLVIIVIAIATMLRIESYGAKKLLVRLIMAAVIVNFSLAIAGVFIDFSHVLTRFFLEGGLGTSNAFSLADNLGAAFSPQRFTIDSGDPTPPDPSEQAGAFTGFATAVLVGVSGSIFSIIFMLIATLVVAALALMLLIRYVALSFLLIFSPLAWLFWIVPALESQFHKWWSKFFQWVFFAPAVSFFIYLAITSVKALGSKPLSVIPGLSGALQTVASQGAQMAVLAGIMIGGLIVAQSMGIAGAAGALKLANSAKAGALKWAGKKAGEGGTLALRSERGRKLTSLMQKTPGFRTAGTFLARQRLAFEKKAADEAKKKLGITKDLKEKALMYGSATTSNAERVQIMDDVSKERNARVKKQQSEQAKVDEKENEVRDLEKQREEARSKGDLETVGKLTLNINAKIEEKKKIEGSESYTKAREAVREIEEVIATLPQEAREELAKAGYKVSNTKLGGLYGRGDAVTATEGGWEKVKAAVKAEEETGAAPEKKTEKKK